MHRTCFVSIALVLMVLYPELSSGLTVKEYLSLNRDQKMKLDLFRERMKPQVPHEYMKNEVYLIRWLRDRNFNLDAAEERLLNHIEWREENEMDTIFDEDWSDFDHDFKVYVEGCSKDGNLVVSMRPGDWEVRKVVLAGKTEKFKRYINKIFEESERMLRRMQEEGQNATQATMLFDLSNFNLVQQGCARCIPLYLYLVQTWEQNFPGTTHKVLFVNAPRLALPLWEIVKNILQPQTRDMISFHSMDKSEWSKILFKEINKDQLSRIFQGTKKEPLDLQDLRVSDKVYKCSHLQ